MDEILQAVRARRMVQPARSMPVPAAAAVGQMAALLVHVERVHLAALPLDVDLQVARLRVRRLPARRVHVEPVAHSALLPQEPAAAGVAYPDRDRVVVRVGWEDGFFG